MKTNTYNVAQQLQFRKVCPFLDFIATKSINSERLLVNLILDLILKDCHSFRKIGYNMAMVAWLLTQV